MTAFNPDGNVRRLTLGAIAILVMATSSSHAQVGNGTESVVTINSAFAGGNVKLTANKKDSVHMEPDLRGGRPWFYWYFEATSTKPGKVTFVFPEKVAGFKNGAIGFQGPALSTDDGKTWNWMGTDHVDGSSFFYDFTKANESVRFAVTFRTIDARMMV